MAVKRATADRCEYLYRMHAKPVSEFAQAAVLGGESRAGDGARSIGVIPFACTPCNPGDGGNAVSGVYSHLLSSLRSKTPAISM